MDTKLPQPIKPAHRRARQRRLLCAALAYIVCIAATAPPAATAQKALDRIVAIVENEAITERQLLENIRRARAVLAQQNREPPNERTLAAQVLQQMIIQQLQLQEAKRLGITIDDLTLDRAVAEMAQRNNLSLAEFKQKVESDNRDFQTLRREIRDELTIRRLVQREVINQIEVSEQEIDDVLMLDETRRSSIEYRFVHLRIPPQTDDDTLDAAKKRFVQTRQKLRGDSFSSLDDLRKRFAQLWKEAGKEDGIKGLRYQVKDLGWHYAEGLPAPVRRRIDTLQDDGTSPVISNDDGLHLFQLLATRSDSPEIMQLQYHVRHILMQPNPIDDDEKIKRELLDIKRQIEDGAGFEALACAHSQDPLSSMKGGDLGWASPRNYVPEFAKAVTQTRGQGGIIGPFKTSFGWHILEVLGTREHDIGNDATRQQALTAIRKGKADEETSLWLLKLRESRRVEVRI